MTDDTPQGERIAKVLARAGVASRRDAERLIADGRVAVNGERVESPALNVGPDDSITLDGTPVADAEPPRLWLYHKPAGLVTTARDEKGRETVFDALPEGLPRVVSIGRLDLTSEGLLLLTNDGEIKRRLELPETGWLRKYRVRVNGTPTDATFEPLRRGFVKGDARFRPMQVSLDRQQGANAWLTIGLREGKNREIRRAMEAVGLRVNRLIRISYGPFRLGDLAPGAVEEVRPSVLRDQLGLAGAVAERLGLSRGQAEEAAATVKSARRQVAEDAAGPPARKRAAPERREGGTDRKRRHGAEDPAAHRARPAGTRKAAPRRPRPDEADSGATARRASPGARPRKTSHGETSSGPHRPERGEDASHSRAKSGGRVSAGPGRGPKPARFGGSTETRDRGGESGPGWKARSGGAAAERSKGGGPRGNSAGPRPSGPAAPRGKSGGSHGKTGAPRPPSGPAALRGKADGPRRGGPPTARGKGAGPYSAGSGKGGAGGRGPKPRGAGPRGSGPRGGPKG